MNTPSQSEATADVPSTPEAKSTKSTKSVATFALWFDLFMFLCAACLNAIYYIWYLSFFLFPLIALQIYCLVSPSSGLIKLKVFVKGIEEAIKVIALIIVVVIPYYSETNDWLFTCIVVVGLIALCCIDSYFHRIYTQYCISLGGTIDNSPDVSV